MAAVPALSQLYFLSRLSFSVDRSLLTRFLLTLIYMHFAFRFDDAFTACQQLCRMHIGCEP